MRDIKLVKKLSAGSYGEVYLGKYESEGLIVKKTKYTTDINTNNSLINAIVKEIGFLQILDSPYIVKIKYIILDNENRPHIGLNKLEGDVLDMTFDVNQIKKFLNNTLKALETLYYHSIIHADLKPANILYKKNHYYIADLGLAMFVPGINEKIAGEPFGTRAYLPSHHELPFHYDRNIDVFNLAITTIQLLTSQNFILDDNIGCLSDVCRKRIMTLLGQSGYDLIINKMLGYGNKINGKNKPISACEALHHPFLTGTGKPVKPCMSIKESWYKEYYNLCINTDMGSNMSKDHWNILVEWMVEVCMEYRFNIRIFYIAVIILKTGLKRIQPYYTKYQAYALGSLKIADIFMGEGYLDFNTMNYLCDFAYGREKDALMYYYLILLKFLNYQIPLVPLFIFIDSSDLDQTTDAIKARTYLVYELCKYNSDPIFSVRKKSKYIIKQFQDIPNADKIAKFIDKNRDDHFVVFKKLLDFDKA